MLNSSGESACLVPDFRGNAFNFSPLRIIFAVGLSYSFYYVEVCSFYSCFLEGFYHKGMLNFVKGFLCIYWDNHMVFIFQFVNVVYHIDWFVNIEESLHPTWSWCMIFFVCCWILFARILFRIYAFMFISDIRVIVASSNEFGSLSSSAMAGGFFTSITTWEDCNEV